MVIQCVSHNSVQEDVEEGGGEHTALSYSDCGSEPVPYAVVKVDCAGGLVIEVLYHSDQFGVDVIYVSWWLTVLHVIPSRLPS